MTIEELAIEAANKEWGTFDPYDYTDHSGRNAGHACFLNGYIQGANAVLKEIEKVFTADYPSIFMAAQAMRDKINELKGKE